MKKLATLTLLLVLTTPALSEQVLETIGTCLPVDKAENFITGKYKELPFAGGPGVIRTPSGFLPGMVKIYVDPVNKGYTVVIIFPDDQTSCMVLMGDDFAALEYNSGKET